MVNEAKCRIYRRKDDKYLIYINLGLGTDSKFPFPLEKNNELYIKVFFNDKKQLIIEKWIEEPKQLLGS